MSNLVTKLVNGRWGIQHSSSKRWWKANFPTKEAADVVRLRVITDWSRDSYREKTDLPTNFVSNFDNTHRTEDMAQIRAKRAEVKSL